jgi:RNA polymerase sigma factor (sigma-70 family)
VDEDVLPLKALQARQKRAAWVGENIVPYEPRIRAWLRRWHVSPEDTDELLQDAYCRIALLESVEHIDRPLSYFFSIVRNFLARRHRRQRIVSFELIAEVDAFQDSPAHGLEDQMSDRLIYQKILGLIDELPPRCREIVRLRKLEDWPQKRIAEHLRISEKTVEAQIRLGLKAIREAWDRHEAQTRIRSVGQYQAGATVR